MEGRKQDKEKIYGSGQNMRGCILTYFRLYKRENIRQLWVIVQELCESRGGRPELSVLTSLLASVDVKIY